MDLIPETFVDAFGEISFKHGMVRIELVSLSGSEPRATQRRSHAAAFSQMIRCRTACSSSLKAGVIRPAQPVSEADPAPAILKARGGNGGVGRW